MDKISVVIEGKEYPCRPTMGALLRFKRETGKEVSDITDDNMSDSLIFLFCCAVSACNHDKVSFPYTSLMDFADALSVEEMNVWQKRMQENSDNKEDKSVSVEKKSNGRLKNT